jgi:hypothetical protein
MMMKTLTFSFLMVLLFSGIELFAQSSGQPEINPADPAFRKQYDNIDFKGNFSVVVLNDNTNNYFLVDFSKLRDKYEKVYFLTLSYKEGKIVNLDGDLSHDKIWFSSNKQNSVDEINRLLLDIKEKTLKSSSSLSAEGKTDWLRENDKFK